MQVMFRIHRKRTTEFNSRANLSNMNPQMSKVFVSGLMAKSQSSNWLEQKQFRSRRRPISLEIRKSLKKRWKDFSISIPRPTTTYFSTRL